MTLMRLLRVRGAVRWASTAARPSISPGTNPDASPHDGTDTTLTESPTVLARLLGGRSTQSLVDALWLQGYPPAMIEGARPLDANTAKLAGIAVTLRFGA